MIRRALVVGVYVFGGWLVEVVERVEQLCGALVHAAFGHAVGVVGEFDAVVGVAGAVGEGSVGDGVGAGGVDGGTQEVVSWDGASFVGEFGGVDVAGDLGVVGGLAASERRHSKRISANFFMVLNVTPRLSLVIHHITLRKRATLAQWIQRIMQWFGCFLHF